MKNDVNMERETLSPIGVISLFDGVSSVLPIVTDILGRQPTIFVGAENDQTLRHLVAEKHGFRLDGKWKKHPSGMCSIYLDDVKKLFAKNCQLFSEIISIAGTECKWILAAGSPCQDFTFAGFSGGLLGLCGPQSSLFFYVHLAIWYLQENYPAGYVRFLVENAGSMQIIHKRAIKEILNIQQCTDDQLRWDSANYFGIKRDIFFFVIFMTLIMLLLLTILSAVSMALVRCSISRVMVSLLDLSFEFEKTWVGFLGCPGLLINLLRCYGITNIGVVKSSLPPKPI